MKKLVIFLLILPYIGLLAQSSDEEYQMMVQKYRDIDYLHYPYMYLDANYQVIMSNEKFNEIVISHKFYPEKIVSYKDSLGVALCGEFDNWAQINIALQRITMSWLRVSYYIWMSEHETKELGSKYNFKMPYELYEYMYERAESWNKDMIDFISQLRDKVYAETKNKEVISMNHTKFLNYALVNNPERIKDFEKMMKERRCNDPNCCQNENSSKEACDKE